MDEKLVVARRYLEALGALDADAMLGEVSDDIVLELPFAPRGLPKRLRGRAEVEPFLRAALSGFLAELELTSLDVRAEADSDRVVAEYTSEGRTAAGRPYANTYVNLIRVRAGKVVESREFYDSAVLAGALDAERRAPGRPG